MHRAAPDGNRNSDNVCGGPGGTRTSQDLRPNESKRSVLEELRPLIVWEAKRARLIGARSSVSSIGASGGLRTRDLPLSWDALQGGCFPAQHAESTRLSHRGLYATNDADLKPSGSLLTVSSDLGADWLLYGDGFRQVSGHVWVGPLLHSHVIC